MDKLKLVFILVALFLLQATVVSALSADEAKAQWSDAKTVSLEKQATYNDARIAYAANKSSANDALVVSTGKDVLNAALDEADAWLVWKDLEAKENPDLPQNLKDAISTDVSTNREKVVLLRSDVAGVQNQLGLGLVYLKMLGKYGELLTDVARDNGKVFVFIGNTQLDKADGYEAKMRSAAETMPNNSEIIAKLDAAKADLAEARSNVGKAEASYNQVVLPGTPMIKFAEGNDYMRVARTNLLSAQSNLYQAYTLMLSNTGG
ncbi:MAG: hypothetical protein V1492_01755 [Candidatus Micrarchaeota archaeon]